MKHQTTFVIAKKNVQVIFCFFILISFHTFSSAQDSLKIDSHISIVSKGQHNLSALASNRDCWHCPRGTIDDNPFFHLAVYTGIDYSLVLNDKITVETGLYLEERSYSGGNNTLSNIVIFPKLLFKTEDTFSVRSKSIGYYLKGGDLWDEDLNDFLRIHNVDYQALIGGLVYKKWTLETLTIGDLSRNVGLDLHQVYRAAISYRHQKIKNQSSITLNDLVTLPQGQHLKSQDVNLANYFRLDLSSELSLEAQIDWRLNTELTNAFASGVKLQYSKSKFKVTTAIRYYTAQFNQGYNGFRPRYYGTVGKYVGPQLYPLKNYYRSFNQWALFTHLNGTDILSYELTSSWRKLLFRKLGFFYDLDLNVIYEVQNRNVTVYPLYNAGLYVEFTPIFTGRASLTNKHMDLTQHFQTFLMSKEAFLSLGFQMNINKLSFKTKYLKV